MTEKLPKFRDAKRAFERDYVLRALRLSNGNITWAAKLAGKDRKDFYDLMERCIGNSTKACRLAGVRLPISGYPAAPPTPQLDAATRKKWGLA